MRVAIHVVPAAGVSAEVDRGPKAASGIATAALRTAERLGADADLVLIAVAGGDAPRLLSYLRDHAALNALSTAGD